MEQKIEFKREGMAIWLYGSPKTGLFSWQNKNLQDNSSS